MMSIELHCRQFRLLLFFALPYAAHAAQPVQYLVDMRAPETHRLQVTMNVPDAAAGTEIQIPAWNALYQIRDFVKDVESLAADCDGQPVDLDREDLNTWREASRPCTNLAFHYAVYANADGPFDSILNLDHAFLNLAMVLFYLPRERGRPVQVKFLLPAGWKLATLLEGAGDEFPARDYDALVDSPVEAGHFEEYSYEQNLILTGDPAAGTKHSTIRVIIDADRADYSPQSILASLQKITTEETTLMQDIPFRRYTFILHFPRNGGSMGGMEHHDGTSIAIPASEVRDNPGYLESVAAHEFFHAWNVKRIRPQGLEPVDYIRGNDTRDLWFCEGVTNTYAQLVLLRAGLIDRNEFYKRIAEAIEVQQSRPARHIQSAETSGREAWLEKYADYNHSQRSVSYYNKGELLGYLLDLDIRHASRNQAGLDDVMRRLNQDFARAGRYYTLADLAAIVAQLAPAFDVNRFLADDVRGTQELDYATYLGYAGLRFEARKTDVAVAGFSASRNAGGALEVDSVDSESDAERAGLQLGDVLMMIDGSPPPTGPDATLPSWRPRQTVQLQIARGGETRLIKFRIGAKQEISIRIEPDAQAGPDQLQVREGWLEGVTNSSSGKP